MENSLDASAVHKLLVYNGGALKLLQNEVIVVLKTSFIAWRVNWKIRL
jgi:hypothetical protein